MKNKPIRSVDDVLAAVRREKQFHTDAVAGGALKSFDEYRHSVGFISGLSHAEQLLKDLLEHQDDEPDLDT